MKQCPICYSQLEIRDCTPCDDCGGDSIDRPNYLVKERTFNMYEVYNGLRLTLCNFCMMDFGAYRSEYFGFTDDRRIEFEHFHFVKEVNNLHLVKDKYCPECCKRLNFLNFLYAVREMNTIND